MGIVAADGEIHQK